MCVRKQIAIVAAVQVAARCSVNAEHNSTGWWRWRWCARLDHHPLGSFRLDLAFDVTGT